MIKLWISLSCKILKLLSRISSSICTDNIRVLLHTRNSSWCFSRVEIHFNIWFECKTLLWTSNFVFLKVNFRLREEKRKNFVPNVPMWTSEHNVSHCSFILQYNMKSSKLSYSMSSSFLCHWCKLMIYEKLRR